MYMYKCVCIYILYMCIHIFTHKDFLSNEYLMGNYLGHDKLIISHNKIALLLFLFVGYKIFKDQTHGKMPLH